MNKEERLLEINKELWDLTKKLTGAMVPYNPPPNKKSLENIKKNSPKVYKNLIRYLELVLEEETLLKNS